MKRRPERPPPPKAVRRRTVGPPLPKQPVRKRPPRVPRPAKRQVAHIIDDDSTLLDVIDNLLNKGVVLNADVMLALANVDLVYLRLSALLCAADRVMQP